MSNQYHAGQKYTREQKEQLDAAFQQWIDADSYAENAPDGIYSDEGRNLAALVLFNAYDTLREEFAAANAPQGNNGEPLATSEWQPGDDALAEQAEEAVYMQDEERATVGPRNWRYAESDEDKPYIHSYDGDGWGL